MFYRTKAVWKDTVQRKNGKFINKIIMFWSVEIILFVTTVLNPHQAYAIILKILEHLMLNKTKLSPKKVETSLMQKTGREGVPQLPGSIISNWVNVSEGPTVPSEAGIGSGELIRGVCMIYPFPDRPDWPFLNDGRLVEWAGL